MKNLIKFFPAALGFLAMTSCSNDDLFNKNEANLEGKKTLSVTTESMSDEYGSVTRAVSDVDANAVEWQNNTDVIKVYDKDLHKYDFYNFINANKAFVLNGANDVVNPEFAVYPSDQVETTFWVKGPVASLTTLTMELPHTIVYSEANMADGSLGYHNELPQWGTVNTVEGGNLKTDLHWLTAFLRIKLANVQGSGTRYITVKMFSDPDLTAGNEMYIAGNFDATLNPDDVNSSKLSVFRSEPGTWKNGTTNVAGMGKSVVIDFGAAGVNAADPNSVVFVPIPADYVGYVALYKGNPDDGTMAGTPFKTLSVKKYLKGTRYGVAEFNLTGDGNTPSAITYMLEKAVENEGVVTISANAPTMTATKNATKDDTKIVIPAGMKAETVKIVIPSITPAGSATGISIENEDPSEPFTGNVVLHVKDASTSSNIDFNLTGANAVSLVGGNGDTNGAYTGAIKVYANEAIIGDGTNKTTASGATFTFSPSQVTKLTVKEKATMGAITTVANSKIAEIVVEGTAGNIDASASTIKPAVKVQGAGVAGNITTNAAVEVTSTQSNAATSQAGTITAGSGNVTISGKGTVGAVTTNGTVTASGEGAITSISARGNVEISGKRSVTGNVASSQGGVTASGEKAVGGDLTAKNAIVISEKRSVTGNISSSDGSVSFNNSEATTFTGTVYAKTTVTLDGKTTVTGKITAEGATTIKGTAKATDIDASGDVTVDVDAQGGKCEAITGTLVFKKKDKVLYLTQGYIKTVTAHTDKNKLTFGENGAYTAIGSVTDASKLIPTNTSKWNKLAVTTDFSNRANYFATTPTAIWTASQFADMANKPATAVDLKVDVDLDGGNFAGIVPTADLTFTGNFKTIKNITLTGISGKGAGLVALSTNKVTVNNLTMTGVKLALDRGVTGNVGAVVGKAADINLSRVKVTLAEGTFGFAASAKGNAKNIGGAIGCATGAVDIKGINITATNAPFAGYGYIGGIIGKAEGNVSIASIGDPNAVDVKVTDLVVNVTYVNTTDPNDPVQGTSGYYIGSIDLTKTINVATQSGVTSFTANGEDLSRNFTIKTDKAFTYQRSDNNPWIGFSGLFSSWTNTSYSGTADLNNITLAGTNKWEMVNNYSTNGERSTYNTFCKFIVTDVN